MDIGRESLATAAAVNQDIVNIYLQCFVVLPQSRESIRNSWKPLKQRKRLDFIREACHPPCRGR
jgi:hypothetical protein